MKCNSCKFDVSPSMTYAVEQNVCPCCGKELIPAVKLAQIKELKRVLTLNKITSDGELDTKIIDRVASILCDYFRFEPLSAGEAIVVQQTIPAPPTATAATQPIVPQVRPPAPPAPVRDPDREAVFEETRAQIENEEAVQAMKEWFPPEVIAGADLTEATMQKLAAARGAMPKVLDNDNQVSRGKNSSIRRV